MIFLVSELLCIGFFKYLFSSSPARQAVETSQKAAAAEELKIT